MEYMLKDEKRLIGIGAYSKVYKSTYKGETVAVKFINKMHRKFVETFLPDELAAVVTLSHPNILSALKIFETTADIAIVMQYCEGDLLSMLSKKKVFEENEAKDVMQQLVCGVSYIHDKGCVHRDLKLDNILYHDGKFKIADWGFACEYKRNCTLTQSVGSLWYASPEIITGKPYLGPPVDIWSLGVILYALLSGHLPFASRLSTESEIRAKIKRSEYEEISKISIYATILLRSMLTVNPELRITASQIMEHPWLSSPNVKPFWQAFPISILPFSISPSA